MERNGGSAGVAASWLRRHVGHPRCGGAAPPQPPQQDRDKALAGEAPESGLSRALDVILLCLA